MTIGVELGEKEYLSGLGFLFPQGIWVKSGQNNKSGGQGIRTTKIFNFVTRPVTRRGHKSRDGHESCLGS